MALIKITKKKSHNGRLMLMKLSNALEVYNRKMRRLYKVPYNLHRNTIFRLIITYIAFFLKRNLLNYHFYYKQRSYSRSLLLCKGAVYGERILKTIGIQFLKHRSISNDERTKRIPKL